MNLDYECLESLESDSTLSQGDVIVWAKAQDLPSKAAVIITADCDLLRGKHWGRITIVPLVPVRSYMEDIYLPKQLESLDEELTKIFATAVRQALDIEGGELPSSDVLESLISLDMLPSVLSNNSRAKLAHSLLRHSRGLKKSMTSAKALDEALRLRNPNVQALSASRIKTFLASPPGDCMVLPALPGLEPGLHVAFLRVMREIRDQDIATKTSEVTPDRAKRIGRLVPVLRYRLTQMLAQVFSDIGLPKNYETTLQKQRDTFVESFSEQQEEQA